MDVVSAALKQRKISNDDLLVCFTIRPSTMEVLRVCAMRQDVCRTIKMLKKVLVGICVYTRSICHSWNGDSKINFFETKIQLSLILSHNITCCEVR